MCKSIWTRGWVDAVPDSYVSGSVARAREGWEELDGRDPYGVTGTYMRIVCFLDYAALFTYNFAAEEPLDNEPRPPLDTVEAIRLIAMELHVTKIEPPGEEDGQELPVVHFRGTSRSMHESWDPNANSNIKGTVRLTKEGEVRWTTFSIYHGEERWRSEGIQVGGVRSSRGTLGNWFGRDFDPHGPAGPTAFWKISDKIDKDEDETDEDSEDSEAMDLLEITIG
jgi:hypothetical protein